MTPTLVNFTLFALALPALGAAAFQMEAFSVGPISARRGETASGVLAIPPGVDAGTEIPVSVIHGAEPGPVLGLIAGNHGYEYPPILALQRLRAILDPTRLKGTVILVHVANLPSFLGRTVYVSPIDGQNLNRMYPGKKNGSVSERIAYAITTEVIDQSDYVVDLHAGDGNESLRPFVYMPVTGDAALDAKIEQMVLAFGFDHIVVDRDRPTDPAASIYCDRTATSRGKPAMTVESGFLGSRDEGSIANLVAGLTGLMRHYGMLEGAPTPVEHPVLLERTAVLTAPVTGVLFPQVERGQTVAEGDTDRDDPGFLRSGARGRSEPPLQEKCSTSWGRPPSARASPSGWWARRAASGSRSREPCAGSMKRRLFSDSRCSCVGQQ